MYVGDLGAVIHSPDDGWFDLYAVRMGCRKKAQSLGVHFLAEEVSQMERRDKRVITALTASGKRIEADHFVNAAGAWAKQTCEMLGF